MTTFKLQILAECIALGASIACTGVMAAVSATEPGNTWSGSAESGVRLT